MESMTQDEKEEGIATAANDPAHYFGRMCWEVTFPMLDGGLGSTSPETNAQLQLTPQEVRQGSRNDGGLYGRARTA